MSKLVWLTWAKVVSAFEDSNTVIAVAKISTNIIINNSEFILELFAIGLLYIYEYNKSMNEIIVRLEKKW